MRSGSRARPNVSRAETLPATVTVRALLNDGSRRLEDAGVADARRTTLQVLGVLLDCAPARLVLDGDRPAPASVPEQLSSRLDQLLAGMPLAYVLGTAGFRTLDLMVDRRVLIPRPETEGLVQLVLDWAGSRPAAWGLAADVGTGSGCIALSLAAEGRFERIVATDVSDGALAVARTNRDLVRPPVPVEFRLGDLLEPLAAERFDVIVANPPYVSEAEWAALDAGVRLHEPHGALVSGAHGMRHIGRLLADAGGLLEPGGVLAIEIDARRSGAARDLARRTGWHRAEVHRDLFGRDRFLLMTKGES